MSRKLLVILLLPALLLIGGYIFLRMSLSKANKQDEKLTGTATSVDSLGGKKTNAVDLRPLFIERLQQLLKKSSQGLYNLSVGDLKLDVLTSTVSLHDVSLSTDNTKEEELKKAGALPANVFKIQFKQLLIEGINLDDALTSKTMDYKLVKLVNPVIHVYRGNNKAPKAGQGEKFPERFLKEMNKLKIDRLQVQGATIVAHGASNKSNKLNDVQISLNDILLDSTTRSSKDRFLFAKNAVINFSNYTTNTSDGLYTFRVGKGRITSPQQQVVLQNISFSSPLGRRQFMARQKLAKELFDLSLSTVTLNKVDWWTLFNGEEIVAGNLLATGGKLSVYFDRSLPLKSRMGNFPNQLIKKLPFKMNLATFNIRDLDFSYTERNPVSRQEGSIYFDNVQLTGRNVSTTNNRPLQIDGSGLFMHQVPVSTRFTFDMARAERGKFSATVVAEKDFEGSLINSFASPLGLTKIEKGRLQKVNAVISGDQHNASGTVTVLYNDLKLAMLEKDRGQKALDKKDVTSLFANLFVIKNDNPKNGKEARVEKASFQRDPNGGFFMLIWKTILVGALKTIGAPEKLAYKKPKVNN